MEEKAPGTAFVFDEDHVLRRGRRPVWPGLARSGLEGHLPEGYRLALLNAGYQEVCEAVLKAARFSQQEAADTSTISPSAMDFPFATATKQARTFQLGLLEAERKQKEVSKKALAQLECGGGGENDVLWAVDVVLSRSLGVARIDGVEDPGRREREEFCAATGMIPGVSEVLFPVGDLMLHEERGKHKISMEFTRDGLVFRARDDIEKGADLKISYFALKADSPVEGPTNSLAGPFFTWGFATEELHELGYVFLDWPTFVYPSSPRPLELTMVTTAASEKARIFREELRGLAAWHLRHRTDAARLLVFSDVFSDAVFVSAQDVVDRPLTLAVERLAFFFGKKLVRRQLQALRNSRAGFEQLKVEVENAPAGDFPPNFIGLVEYARVSEETVLEKWLRFFDRWLSYPEMAELARREPERLVPCHVGRVEGVETNRTVENRDARKGAGACKNPVSDGGGLVAWSEDPVAPVAQESGAPGVLRWPRVRRKRPDDGWVCIMAGRPWWPVARQQRVVEEARYRE